jgi:Flp pilus assembly protein TadG
MPHESAAQRRRRRASIALESLFVLPILVIVALAVVEFSMLISARQQLLAASREGARAAATGGSPREIELAVRSRLGHGTLSQAKIRTILVDEDGRPLASGEPVVVQVEVPATAASPDLLRVIGYSLRQQTVTAYTAMRKE